MTGPNEKVMLVDLHGPYTGQPREYLFHAAEAAVANGFAKWPETDTAIPDDFPLRVKLLDAGLETMEALAEVADFTAYPGIGKKGAADIKAALE